MRFLVDIVENVTSSIRFIVGLFVVAGLLIGLFMSVGVATVAPAMVERVGEKAIAAEKAQRIAQDMGKDGWGYSAAAASAGEQAGAADAPAAGEDGWAE